MTTSDQSKGSRFAKWNSLPDKFGAMRLRGLSDRRLGDTLHMRYDSLRLKTDVRNSTE